ncbi:Kunitz/Bovine pancreatic trypsin inhibitor domain protein [Teladorsagia circumcincta]|uniref:Kunitz/Bovine pancreatic trypsin inhibitor domain protein n=1 Tax=Teladorsagia circumcincta TaxID=45464 RepID=A0A2G9UR39_TELCI|nr:Kunitz/Bovine pancreatic trypsin inhibitor domain protein [Teladorsagia circumcincta]
MIAKTSFSSMPMNIQDLTESEQERRDALSCPNGLQELRYADGRPVMCLPGKNQCPEKSSCYFNGVDFFCCPNEEDPYDKHVFGGYDGEETKHGYKVFGPLNIRRLMDEVPLRVRRNVRSIRARRQATDNIFSSGPAAFNIDSITAPLRFDDEKPRTVSRAQRMRAKPSPPHHGNPICIEPLATGDCDAAHLRYYYDRDSDKCRLFYYTGCKGNNNNFGSVIDCQRLCVLGGQRPKPESFATPPPILRGQCPDGTAPLGGSAPVLCGNTTDSIGCPIGFYCLRGPPDVCCSNKEVAKKVEKGSVRFAPEAPGVPRAYSRNSLLATPKFMCPDASDPLMASNGEPTSCGAGFDGMKLCPKGFYCAIDVEKQSRMCCPLYGAAERVPTEQGSPPYLGRRPSNPGEVLERGSLPSDQSEFITRAMKEKMQEQQRQRLETTTSVFGEESEEFEDEAEEEEDDEDGMAHLMLKPAEAPQPKATSSLTTALPESEDEHPIDLPTEPPAVEETPVVKAVEDKSVCQIKPSEGRACREDEVPPRTNLHYFYSPKDRRCKLYFFRGCGGNANRFEKKADCERLCLP